MKYHYKTPHELSPEGTGDQPTLFRWRRANLIVLFDLLIILLVFGAMYYAGVFSDRRLKITDTIEHGPFTYSATFQWKEEAGGVEIAVYLNVKNTSPHKLSFPLYAPGAPSALEQARLEVLSAEEQLSLSLRLETRDIQPGQTALFYEHLRLAKAKGTVVRCRLKFGDTEKVLYSPRAD